MRGCVSPAALASVAAVTPFQVLTDAQCAVGQHHADDGVHLRVQLDAAGVKQRGDVLMGCQFAAGPNLVALLAHLPEFLADDVRALTVGEPRRVADDSVNLFLGDHCGPDHVPDVVRPHVVAVGGV